MEATVFLPVPYNPSVPLHLSALLLPVGGVPYKRRTANQGRALSDRYLAYGLRRSQ